jgi:hypothetical protein
MGGDKRTTPSIETPEEFKTGSQGREGLADRILKAKEKERERIRLEDEKRRAKEARKGKKADKRVKR